GKSTLVRALAGDLEPLAGQLFIGNNVRIGYFAQHQIEQLDLQASPLLHLKRLSPDATEQKLRRFLGGFDFRGDMATDPVGPRSGGEKARLVLALLVWQAPNLLLLDEPTNHLDLEMRHALTMALQGFEGAVITVSHDRHLLENTVTDYLLVASGRVGQFNGDLDDYRKWLNRERLDEQRQEKARAEDVKPAGKLNKKAARKAAAAERDAFKSLRSQSKKLMNQIDVRTAELKGIEGELAAPELYQDENQPRLQKLLKAQIELRQKIAALETEWASIEEKLEESNPV
ncbi:MAG: ATP-binding cassette domain-containing protein, partial [Gammaproteobacteria bacterium]